MDYFNILEANRFFSVLPNIAFAISLLIIALISYHFNSKNIDPKIAYYGAGPQSYVAEKLYPENFFLCMDGS